MVLIEEGDRRLKHCKKPRQSDRRCYAVKVFIEKNPTAKTSKGKLREPCVRIEKSALPDHPPPPITTLLPPLRNPVRIGCGCDPVGVTRKRTKKRRVKYNENEAQTQPQPSLNPRKKENETQCNFGPPKFTQEQQCQTNPQDLKDKGHQTTMTNENNQQHCQTELEIACSAVGDSHDTNVCIKPCCKKANEKRDVSSQAIANNDREKVNSCRANKKCGNQPVLEQKYKFPFAGRTPSGNLKVRPSMISYENKEFGILVADRNSIRTTVKRMACCKMIHEENVRLPRTAPPPPPSFPKYFSCPSPGESCKTAYTRPHSHVVRTMYCRPHHYHNESDRNDLELVEASYYTGKIIQSHKMNETSGQTHTSHNKSGHTDGWKYVNPHYKGANPYHCERLCTSTDALDPSQSGKTHKEKPAQATCKKGNQVQAARNECAEVPQQGRHISTGMNVYEHGILLEDIFNHDYNSGGGRNSELAGKRGKGKPEGNHEGRPAPYVPAFPQDKIRHQTHHQNIVSDAEGYYTPTQVFSDDDRTISTACYSRTEVSMRQSPQVHHNQQQYYDEQNEQRMMGTLRYVVKGNVDPDAQVTVGDATFPVHSVVLEIHSKPPENVHPHMETQIKNMKLPDFNYLPIKYNDSKMANDNRTTNLEDRACMTSPIESGRNMRPNNEQKSTNNHIPSPSFPPGPHRPTPIPSSSRPLPQANLSQHVNKPHQRLPPGYDRKSQIPHDLRASRSCRPLRNSPSRTDLVEALHAEIEDPDLGQDPSSGLGPDQGPGSDIGPDLGSDIGPGPDPDPDYLESKHLVSIKSEDTILRFAERHSSVYTSPSKIEESPKEDSDLTPQDTPPSKSSHQIENPEEQINDTEGLLPNLDVIKDAVLVFGGLNPIMPCAQGNSGKEVYMYMKDADDWRVVGKLPKPRAHFGLARVDNDVYIIGGTDPEHKDNIGKSIAVHTNFRVNLRTGKFDLSTGLENARSHCGCVAIGKNIYIIGGSIESRATATCLVFNTGSRTWSSIAPMNSTRSNMGIAVFRNGILVAGGTSKDARKPVLETVLYYEPTVNSWTAWRSLPSPRAFGSLAVAKGKIYYIAGAGLKDVQKRRNSSVPEVLSFNTENKSWVEVGVLRHSRHGHATAVLGESIVIIAGISSHAVGPINSVEIWSTSSPSNKSIKAKNFPHAQSGMDAIVL